MIDSLIQDLRELTTIPGISGHEDAIAREMALRLRAYAAEVSIDQLANVIARLGPEKAAPAKRVAVLAHLDTVGMMVKQTSQDGLLRVVQVGSPNLKALPGTAVRIGSDPAIPGVIGVRSHHLAQPGDAAVNSIEELYIQIAPDQSVEVTTPVSYATPAIDLGGGLFASPHLDNRAGCAVLLELARQLTTASPHESLTIYLVGTAQEETTCMGAYHALSVIQPDAAIFVDGTVSYDTPETRGRGAIALGDGPVLTAFLYVPGLNAWHAHPGLRAHLKSIAAREGIPYQQDAVHGLMSDSRVATLPGIPSAVIGLPMRGKHSPLEVVHTGDLMHAVQMLGAALRAPLPDLSRG